MVSILEGSFIMARFIIFPFILLSALSSTVFAENVAERLTQARVTVEAYCQNEFSGNDPETRERLIKFSPKFEAKFNEEEHKWIAKYVESPQVVVVSAFAIKSVNLSGERATADVIFKRLASTNKTNTSSYLVETPRDEIVRLNMVFKEKKWWVLDPPPPRISKEVLIRSYEATIKRLRENGWLSQPDLSRNQKSSFDNDVENLRILKSLP